MAKKNDKPEEKKVAPAPKKDADYSIARGGASDRVCRTDGHADDYVRLTHREFLAKYGDPVPLIVRDKQAKRVEMASLSEREAMQRALRGKTNAEADVDLLPDATAATAARLKTMRENMTPGWQAVYQRASERDQQAGGRKVKRSGTTEVRP